MCSMIMFCSGFKRTIHYLNRGGLDAISYHIKKSRLSFPNCIRFTHTIHDESNRFQNKCGCVFTCFSHGRLPRTQICRTSHSGRNDNSNDHLKVSRKRLLYAVYVSFAIGGSLLTLIVIREIKKAMRRIGGVEEISEPNCGRKGLIIKYKDVALPAMLEQVLEKVKTFQCREDDIWVVSFPRSGITWAQELVYLIKTSDFQGANDTNIEDRFPYLEYYTDKITSQANQTNTSPRFIKTHLPLRLFPLEIVEKKPKMIYIARNPKDVVVSYYFFVKMLKPLTRYKGDFKAFFDAFLYGKAPYTPWWRHVQEFWEIKDRSNVLFITYEDLHEDLEGTINNIAYFLDKKLTDDQVKQIAEHCSFEKMKENKSVNYSWWDEKGYCDPKSTKFFREGKVGNWKEHFTSEMNKQMDTMIALKFGGSGLFFQYDSKPSETDSV